MDGFAKEWSKYLPENHRKALYTALCTLTDEFFYYDPESEENVFRDLLPRRYTSFYNPIFLKKFFVSFLTVSYKLALSEGSDTLIACTAEEIALHILIERASAVLEMEGIESDFDAFEDMVLQDVDFEFLYEPESEWIDEKKNRDELGMANLHPSEWFKPFLNAAMPIHPYCQEE